MSILIKGMEMPKGCGSCPCGIYGDCDAVTPRKKLTIKHRWSGDERPDWCPLVPVPEHGRLIDADAFKKYISVAFEKVAPELSGGYSWLAKQLTEDLIKDIDDAPTVIPADGKDTNVGEKEET